MDLLVRRNLENCATILAWSLYLQWFVFEQWLPCRFSSSAAFNLFLALMLQFGCGILNNFIPKVENNIYLIIHSFIGS